MCLKECPCYNILIIFSSEHVLDTSLMYNSRTHLFINLSSIVRFSKYLYQGLPNKAEHCMFYHMNNTFRNTDLDICACAFNQNKSKFLEAVTYTSVNLKIGVYFRKIKSCLRPATWYQL